jgi:hypothetical protein
MVLQPEACGPPACGPPAISSERRSAASPGQQSQDRSPVASFCRPVPQPLRALRRPDL